MSQTVLKQMPAGITPPLLLSYRASSAPILQLALSSGQLSETTLYDQATSFIRPQLISVPGAAIPFPYGGKVHQIQADLDPQALPTYGLSANDVINALAVQNLIIPAGTQKIGTYEYKVSLNNPPTAIDSFNQLPIKTVNGTATTSSSSSSTWPSRWPTRPWPTPTPRKRSWMPAPPTSASSRSWRRTSSSPRRSTAPSRRATPTSAP